MEDALSSGTTALAGDNPQDTEKDKKDGEEVEERSIRYGENDLLSGEMVDEVLAAKMKLVNDVRRSNVSFVAIAC